MGVFQIVFLALNLAVPYWLWTRTSSETAGGGVDWTMLEKNLARLIESDEGFPNCSTLEVVDVIHKLCERSHKNFHDGNPSSIERASKQVVFSCYVTKGSIKIGWHLEDNPDSELECREPGGDVIPLGPEFTFNEKGRMRSIEFSTALKTRQTVPYRNCRAKATKVQTLDSAPADIWAFLREIGRTPGDPEDFISANLICLTFDSSPLWKPWREKYLN